MSDMRLRVRNSEDGREHVIDCPPDIQAADFTAELIEGLQLLPGNWVLDDEECAATLDPKASLSSNGVANGHHLRLHRNGIEPQKVPRKHLAKEERPEKEYEEEIQPPPRKERRDDDRRFPYWVTASLSCMVLLLLLVAAVRWLILTPPRVAITLTPKDATVQVSERTRFVAAVKGSRNQEVRWTLTPAVGDITPDGVYTAPALAESGDAGHYRHQCGRSFSVCHGPHRPPREPTDSEQSECSNITRISAGTVYSQSQRDYERDGALVHFSATRNDRSRWYLHGSGFAFITQYCDRHGHQRSR